MDLQTIQTIYYSMSIFFMSLVFVAILIVLILITYILRKIAKLQKQVEAIVTDFQKDPGAKAAEVAMAVGKGIADAGVKKVKEMMGNK
jgi:hypothetical protein